MKSLFNHHNPDSPMLHITYTADNIEGGQQTFKKSPSGRSYKAERLLAFLRRHHDNVKVSITHID